MSYNLSPQKQFFGDLGVCEMWYNFALGKLKNLKIGLAPGIPGSRKLTPADSVLIEVKTTGYADTIRIFATGEDVTLTRYLAIVNDGIVSTSITVDWVDTLGNKQGLLYSLGYYRENGHRAVTVGDWVDTWGQGTVMCGRFDIDNPNEFIVACVGNQVYVNNDSTIPVGSPFPMGGVMFQAYDRLMDSSTTTRISYHRFVITTNTSTQQFEIQYKNLISSEWVVTASSSGSSTVIDTFYSTTHTTSVSRTIVIHDIYIKGDVLQPLMTTTTTTTIARSDKAALWSGNQTDPLNGYSQTTSVDTTITYKDTILTTKYNTEERVTGWDSDVGIDVMENKIVLAPTVEYHPQLILNDIDFLYAKTKVTYSGGVVQWPSFIISHSLYDGSPNSDTARDGLIRVNYGSTSLHYQNEVISAPEGMENHQIQGRGFWFEAMGQSGVRKSFISDSFYFTLLQNSPNYSFMFHLRHTDTFSYFQGIFDYTTFLRTSRNNTLRVDDKQEFFEGCPVGTTTNLTGLLCEGNGGLGWDNPMVDDGFTVYPFTGIRNNDMTYTKKLNPKTHSDFVAPSKFFIWRYWFGVLLSKNWLMDMVIVQGKQGKYFVNGIKSATKTLVH